MNELKRLDLNLLLSLDALLSCSHLTRAAEQLNKSQPAMSHDLAKLRVVFNDPLLIKQGRGLSLSYKAEHMRSPVKAILEHIRQLVLDTDFDPQQTERTFRLAMSDYGVKVVLSKLMPILRKQAPHIKIDVLQLSRRMMMDQVVEGHIDIAFGVFDQTGPKYIRYHPLFNERFMSIMDRHYLAGRQYLNLAEWLSFPHVLVAVQTHASNEIDRVLNDLGCNRNIQLVLPHWNVASEILSGTDLILTIAEKSIDTELMSNNLVCFQPPITIPSFEFSMIWHQNKDSDPALQWLIKLLMSLMQADVESKVE